MTPMSQSGITPKTITTSVPAKIGTEIGRSAGAKRFAPGSRKNIAFITRT